MCDGAIAARFTVAVIQEGIWYSALSAFTEKAETWGEENCCFEGLVCQVLFYSVEPKGVVNIRGCSSTFRAFGQFNFTKFRSSRSSFNFRVDFLRN